MKRTKVSIKVNHPAPLQDITIPLVGRTINACPQTPPTPVVQRPRNPQNPRHSGAFDHGLIPEGLEAEWVSKGDEVKEAALWSGRLASVRRCATAIAHSGLVTITDEDESNEEVVDLGKYLYEPDGAVIRAGLVGVAAAGVGGGLVDAKRSPMSPLTDHSGPHSRSPICSTSRCPTARNNSAASRVRARSPPVTPFEPIDLAAHTHERAGATPRCRTMNRDQFGQ
ncbi:MAG: hypothetical protein R2693_03240 [Nocardioidaceae bacterium]